MRGFIGGESHDSYLIRARKGQTLIVRLSWRREGENLASFSVKESPDYYTAEPVKFGTESDDGKRWVGRIPKSGNYYIEYATLGGLHSQDQVNEDPLNSQCLQSHRVSHSARRHG